MHREGLARGWCSRSRQQPSQDDRECRRSSHLQPSPLPPRYIIAALEYLPTARIRTYKRYLLLLHRQPRPLPAASPPALAAKLALVSQDVMTTGPDSIAGGRNRTLCSECSRFIPIPENTEFSDLRSHSLHSECRAFLIPRILIQTNGVHRCTL